jgi:vacuolar protein sorting-associated protein 51
MRGARTINAYLPDSTAFDAKAYYEQLITTSSLPALLKRENDLLSGTSMFKSELDRSVLAEDNRNNFYTEIRQLDSERQSLVYNHHHELVAASDTIAAVL